ncbi:unnamed protein product [Paramecium primaurelia]|uniref:Uncharacterized protein n=1 Tax=Paramecium primaurelia TaxID=5886 RepID=A0A8S1Q2M1_PARPR|nr:unnamed protein product [Paramecium primaurelia]
MLTPKMIENEKDFFCPLGHNLQVVKILLDPKLSKDQRLLCNECLKHTKIDAKMVELQKIFQLIEDHQVRKMGRVENIIMDQIKIIQSLQSIFDKMKQNVIQQLNQLIKIMMEWILHLQQFGSQYSKYSFYQELEIMLLNQNKAGNLQKIIDDLEKNNLCWTQKLEYNQCKQLLKSLESITQNYSLSEYQQQISIQPKTIKIQEINTKLNIEQSLKVYPNHSTNLKPLNFQIIQKSSISQSDTCFAIAFDNDCSTLVAGCDSKIKVYEFNQGNIKQIQTLYEHKEWVYTLNFMKKQKQFISGSRDKSIIVWKQNQMNLWSLQQILNGHNYQIFCLVINTNDDLIISGSGDKTIKFWMKKNEWLCQQTITDHSNHVYGLSLNQQQNKVVSCGYDKIILIIEQSEWNKEWKVIQKITIEQCGYRVCFIDNNMFTLSPRDKEQIFIFEMNTMNNQFTKTKEITIQCGSDGQCLFPLQYINSKCILLSKNGEYVNVIRKKQYGNFLTEQSIHFKTTWLYGGMSNDGEYLITWDKESKQIQIWKDED